MSEQNSSFEKRVLYYIVTRGLLVFLAQLVHRSFPCKLGGTNESMSHIIHNLVIANHWLHPRFSGVCWAPFQTNTCSKGVEPNPWLPSWWGGAEGGLAMSPAKKPPLPRPPCTGHQREREERVVQRSHGDGRWRKKYNRWERPGVAFPWWRRTGWSGGITLLPYTPPGVMGMREWELSTWPAGARFFSRPSQFTREKPWERGGFWQPKSVTTCN